MRFKVLGPKMFEIGMHVFHGCRDADVSDHFLHDARAGAAVNGVGHEGMTILVRGNGTADNERADLCEYLPQALPGKRLSIMADEQNSVVRLLGEARPRLVQVQTDSLYF